MFLFIISFSFFFFLHCKKSLIYREHYHIGERSKKCNKREKEDVTDLKVGYRRKEMKAKDEDNR